MRRLSLRRLSLKRLLLRRLPLTPRGRSLRARLITGLLALLLLIFAGVGVAVTSALHTGLLDRLDQQLADTGGRYAASLEHAGTGRSDTRAQAPGTLGARLLNGTVTAARVVDGDADDTAVAAGTTPADTDDTVTLDAADRRALADLPVGGPARTVQLSGPGEYRVRAVAGQDGDVLVTGLPMRPVEDTMHQVMMVEVVVFGSAVLVAGLAGTGWLRLALRPLDRIAATATRVSALPLARGEVEIEERVPDEAADPHTETGRVGLALNRMLGHVEDALAQRHTVEDRLRAFAADAGHELRTPVATVRGHAELALRHPEIAPPVRHALERIEAESRRMGTIVDDLLLLARLDAGRPLARAEVDLTRLALDCIADARAAAPEHNWRLELPAEPVLTAGDEDRLRQVVANLLSNAHRHTPPGSTVTLRLTGGQLTVGDDGPGIPEALRPQLFERFARADHSRSRSTGGTGLGLAIARAIARAHGGELALAPTTGPGAVFELTLPGYAEAPGT
ncbi:two-component system OmpR family sensor kinase [Kitasatospora sp. GP30]|uniref:sensor histidine kinase n=1 Tax=Kitasatospora sp. GP30 TaxID=3035084 RepID=UPI000C70472A|nr:HAMP domain-containing sensor histidine kinase [Kitasatospora sp. GP30]MDH6140977.1 two-component system OmpR family sensor kinase [Kitasatospora sp. GP30]